MASPRRAGDKKLFKLKGWVTAPEAARYLSLLFDEEVNEADVLRLALDDKLKLSVKFPSGTFGKSCSGTIDDLNDFTDENRQIKSLDKILKAEDRIVPLAGIYDLPMIGAEKNIVNNKLHQLISDSEQKFIYLIETVVEGQDGQLYLVQKIYYNEHQTNSADNIIIKNYDFSVRYGPENGFPEGSVLVVRTSALHDLEERISAKEPGTQKRRSEKEEKTDMHIIGVLLEIIKSNKLFQNEDSLRDYIAEGYKDLSGCSERTLAGRFSKAKKLIKEALSY